MIDITLRRIIKEISEELNIDEDIIHEACVSEFSFVVDKMREYKETKENAPILLNHLGKFTGEGRAKYFRKVKASLYPGKVNDRK